MEEIKKRSGKNKTNQAMKLNKEWHLAHRMPKNPTEEQRLAWHIEHAMHCRCREIPPKLKAEIKKRKIKIS